MNKQHCKRQVLTFYPLGKTNSGKPYGGGGGGEGGVGIAPLYVGGLIFLARNFLGHGLIFSNVHHAGKKKEAKCIGH